MDRAVIYTRISKDRTGAAAGVARQLADCEKLCSQRGWEIVERLEDNDRSAFSGRERPGYERLLDLVTDGRVDVVVAWHSDRLWRSVLEQQLFLAAGREAGLHLVATPSGEFDPGDGDDEFMSTLMAAVARKESADKSRRLRRKHTEIAERGGHSGGPRVFGYDTLRTRIVDDEAAEIRRAAERILAGEPPSAITKDWNDRGVTTPYGHRWTDTTARRMLAAPRYAGLRTSHGDVVATAEWEPILDLETHQRIARYFVGRAVGRRARPARKFLLTGLLRCGKCGAPMHGGTTSGGQAIYICPPPARNGCSGVTVNADHAEDALREMAITMLDTAYFKLRVSHAVDDAIDSDTRQAELAKQLGADRSRLTELAELWADGELERSEWSRARQRLVDRIEATERELNDAIGAGPLLAAPGGGELAERWPSMSVDHRRALLELLLDHVDVLPSGSRIGKPRAWFDPERLEPAWRV